MLNLTDAQFLIQTKLTKNFADYLANEFIDNLFQPDNIQPILDNRYNYIQSRQRTRFNSRDSIVANEILSLQFHPNGNWLIYSRMDGSLNLWSLIENNSNKGLFNLDPSVDHLHSADIVGTDNLITCISWDPKSLDISGNNRGNIYNSNKNNFVTSMNNNQLFIWNIQTGSNKQKNLQILQKISLSNKKIKLNKCFYSNNGNWIYGITKNDGIFIFDSKINSNNHIDNMNADHNDNFLYHWDVKRENLLNDNDVVYSFEIDKLDKLVFLGLKSGKIIVGQMIQSDKDTDNKLKINYLTTLNNHRTSITSLKFDPMGRFLFSGSTDGTLIFWNILQGFQIEHTITDINNSINMLDVDNLGKLLSVCTENGKVSFYDINNANLFCVKQLDTSLSLPILKFLPNKAWFITSVENDVLNMYTMESTDILQFWKLQYDTKLKESRLNYRNSLHNSHKNFKKLTRSTNSASSTQLKKQNIRSTGDNKSATNRYLNKSPSSISSSSGSSNIPLSLKRGGLVTNSRSSYVINKKRGYDRNRFDRDPKMGSYNNSNYGSSRFNR